MYGIDLYRDKGWSEHGPILVVTNCIETFQWQRKH